MTIAHPDVPTTDADSDHVLAAMHRIRRWMRSGLHLGFTPPRRGVGALCPSSVAELSRVELGEINGVTRHAGVCMTTSCAHWVGHCSLGVAVATAGRGAFPDVEDRGVGCELLDRCRWRAENGPSACGLCPAISRLPITELIARTESVHQGDQHARS